MKSITYFCGAQGQTFTQMITTGGYSSTNCVGQMEAPAGTDWDAHSEDQDQSHRPQRSFRDEEPTYGAMENITDEEKMIDDLQALLDSHKIRHFSAKEIVRARRWNKLLRPPEDLWDNVILALVIADCAREALGAPVRLVSGYRNDRYNVHVKGSDTSEHKEFKALDLQPFDADRMEEFRQIMVALVEYARLQGVDARLIHYDTFVHVDVGAAQNKPRGSRLSFS